MIKHLVYVIVHRETRKLLSVVVFDDEERAETVRQHILPNMLTGTSYPAAATEVLELELVK